MAIIRTIQENRALVCTWVVTIAFIISTIVLATELSRVQGELKNLQHQMSSTTVTPVPTTPGGTNPSTGGTTPGGTNPSTAGTTPGGTKPSTAATTPDGIDPSSVDTTAGIVSDTTANNPSTEAPTTQPPVPPGWETNYRVPEAIQPLSYEVTLTPDLAEGLFSGLVTIKAHVSGSVDYIPVHQKYLTIEQTAVVGPNGDIAGYKIIDYPENEFYVLSFPSILPEGDYEIKMEFWGNLTRDIVGFYRSTYREGSELRSIATSKFQPTYARQAFPCFDEPGFKANFSIKLVAPQGYSALSNMDVNKTTTNGDLTTYEFSESVPMVTYLACFIVSDFERLEPLQVENSEETFPFSVYSTPGQVNKTNYALNIGAQITQHYIQMFKIDYPLPKLDMIAIPDFVSGAMEHWGLITFREVNLLFDDESSSVTNKQSVASVVAHELAHMWFGNLMTLKWWDDLWLNEGFASFMEFKGVDAVHPDWSMMDQFLIDNLHPVLKLDAVLSSHPIVQPVSHPDEITSLFDTISYNKGASIIRMLEDFLTVEKFELGITNFLNKFKFSNAVTQDLWNSLQEIVDTAGQQINITDIMGTWTRQMGFPVIAVTINTNGSRTLTQNRFLADPEAVSETPSPYDYKWDIPITYISGTAEGVQRLWFQRDQLSLDVPSVDESWIKINAQQVGYYRVNYDPSDWKKLSNLLLENIETLGPSDRAHLLEDSFSLAEASQLDYMIPLEMTYYLENENHYVPWSVAAAKFHLLFTLVSSNAQTSEKLKSYVQKQVSKIYHEIGWNVEESDSHLNRRLRMTVLQLACSADLTVCKEQASQHFITWIENANQRPHPDIRNLVYRNGMTQNENIGHFNQMWEVFVAENNAQERNKLMYGLTGTKDTERINWFLEQAKNEEYIRSQDFFTCLQYLGDNPYAQDIVWKFVRDEWEYLVNRFTLNNRYLGNMVKAITQSFSTQEKLQEMLDFFERYPQAGAGEAARKQALEIVENNIKWVEKNLPIIDGWLNSQ